jgi:hypothetical protein
MFGYYSYAGSNRGDEDPAEINVFTVHGNGEGCSLRGCVHEDCEHLVIEWGGSPYSKSNTWIAADDDDYVSLAEME